MPPTSPTVIRATRSRSSLERTAQSSSPPRPRPVRTHSAMPPAFHWARPTSPGRRRARGSPVPPTPRASTSWPRSTPDADASRSRKPGQPVLAVGTAGIWADRRCALRDDAEPPGPPSGSPTDPTMTSGTRGRPGTPLAWAANSTPTSPTCSTLTTNPGAERETGAESWTRARPVLEPPTQRPARAASCAISPPPLERRYLGRALHCSPSIRLAVGNREHAVAYALASASKASTARPVVGASKQAVHLVAIARIGDTNADGASARQAARRATTTSRVSPSFIPPSSTFDSTVSAPPVRANLAKRTGYLFRSPLVRTGFRRVTAWGRRREYPCLFGRPSDGGVPWCARDLLRGKAFTQDSNAGRDPRSPRAQLCDICLRRGGGERFPARAGIIPAPRDDLCSGVYTSDSKAASTYGPSTGCQGGEDPQRRRGDRRLILEPQPPQGGDLPRPARHPDRVVGSASSSGLGPRSREARAM